MFALGASFAIPTLAPSPDAKDHWAVLIAGSSGYGNYRHQADVCHAYHVMINGGVPADHIITLAVDDIANSRSNPFPGKVFNKPTDKGTPGVDVYEGCKIDYSGKMVTPDTFTKVLTGDATGLNGGKVLASTATSKVFVNFVDHGGVDLIGFPSTTMHVKEFEEVLKQMHASKMYKELVFYLEACESGSMFQWLNSDANAKGMKLYATTAANAKESSWGTYCMPQDMVDGKHIGSCLGDLYSVNWMEDADKGKFLETLKSQFERVKALTNKSHVLQFGDTAISHEPIRDFEGDKNLLAALPATAPLDAVSLSSFDATLESAYQRARNADQNGIDELNEILMARAEAKRRFEGIARRVSGIEVSALPPHEGHDVDCHYTAHMAHTAHCGEYHPETLFHSATLASLCKATNGDATGIVAAIKAECSVVEAA